MFIVPSYFILGKFTFMFTGFLKLSVILGSCTLSLVDYELMTFIDLTVGTVWRFFFNFSSF
jgi:hypothetical protein